MIKCDNLEDMYTHQVACGHGFTLFLVDPDDAKMKDFPVFDPEDVHQLTEEISNSDEKPARKKKKTTKAEDVDEKPVVKKRASKRKTARGKGRQRRQRTTKK